MGAFKEALSTLQTFQLISDFIKNQRRRKRIPAADLFNRGIYGPFLDAWIFAKVAVVIEKRVGEVKLRLVSQKEQFPDAKLLVGPNEYDFEITEVMEPERRRGDEYKKKKENQQKGIAEKPELMGHAFEEGDRLGAKWIANGIEKKVKKKYSIKSNLIVHANFLCYELLPDPIASSALAFAVKFDSIWIVHSDAVLQLYDSTVFGKTDLLWHTNTNNHIS